MQTRKRAEKWLRDLKLRFSRYLGNKLLVSIDQLEAARNQLNSPRRRKAWSHCVRITR